MLVWLQEGAAEVPATTTLRGAISEDTFRAGVESANDGAQVSITSYEMSVDMDTRVEIPAATLRTPAGEQQFKEGLAATLGVSVSQISGFSVASARRRRMLLAGEDGQQQPVRRQLQAGAAVVSYTITAPMDISDRVNDASFSQGLVDNVNNAGGGSTALPVMDASDVSSSATAAAILECCRGSF